MEQNEQILDSQELSPISSNTPKSSFPWMSLLCLLLAIARLAEGRVFWGSILLLLGCGSIGYYIYEKNKDN